MADSFYALYREFLVQRRHGLVLLADVLSERQERHPLPGPVFELLTSMPALLDDRAGFRDAAAASLEKIPIVVKHADVTPVLRNAIGHSRAGAIEQFRFFVAALAAVYAWRVRIPAQSLTTHGAR